MNPHRHDIEKLYAHLHSSAQGLSQAEAARRLARYGPNQLEKIGGQPLSIRLLKEFTHFFALILWLAAGLAFFAEWREPGQGMAMLGYAVVGVIVINGLFSFWQEYRAEKALAALRNLLPRHTTALRDGRAMQVPVAELVPGDVVVLAAGDDVPADCRLIEAFAVRVNTANLTGESKPKSRATTAPIEAEQVAMRRDILHAGTSLISGNAKAMVYATGMHTEFGNIARLTQVAQEPLSPLQKEIAHLSRLVALFATLLGVLFFFIGQSIGLSLWANLIFAIGIIVANVPEGLLPTVTLSLAMATQRMAKKNALVRHLTAVETLGSATVICSDKTGTLTQNRMSIRQVYFSGAQLFPDELDGAEPLYDIMRHCHDLRRVEHNGQQQWQGDPMEVALLQATPAGTTYPRVDEIPFDTERKRMSVICDTPQGRMLYCKGAPETVLPLCNEMMAEEGRLPLDDESRLRIMNEHELMTADGLRVIALAYRSVPQQSAHREAGMVFAGLVGLVDPARPGVAEAIATCAAAGIRVIMITGDHPHTASALARDIGLGLDPLAIIGERLCTMSDTDLQLLLDEPVLIFARTSADQKMRIVQALQRKGEIVAVTGDGVNDAPALKCADIGIAMGISGTDVAKEAADIILLDDHFATIVTAIEEGRAVYDNVRKFLTYILTSNIPEIVPYLAFVLFRIPLPLTIIQILAVDLGTDMLPALALGAEKPDSDVMRRPPRPRNEHLLSRGVLLRAYFFLGPLEAVAGMAAFFFVLHGGGWTFGRELGLHDPLYLQATTACLSAIIAMQVVNVFMCRHPVFSVFSRGRSFNRLIVYGIGFELLLLLLITYTPWGNALFGTAPLAGEVWLFMLPFGLGMWLLEELRKALIRQRIARNGTAGNTVR
ncbi:cation-translocating P-type ATPase [Sideroxydans lithotrophicus]|uniref:ATPase, P-type (Transporting), HAD superfamily, subfamily IC n=1 Tax=Sideroxydans lithotrophicus (strain ES-1) TaxID=580332 RepID=D5CR50_SIDLE|nr:cation-transporting P-type ATPase [Sideroxydans lithotrophicus]ADE11436.1 ATPase, P-type (transporting), HAD superfamily, subfamily IC [Sideroxydans lithotrophicus ES-1]